QPSRPASASRDAGWAASSAAAGPGPAPRNGALTGSPDWARQGGTQASSVASRPGNTRPASRISRGADSAPPERSVEISVGSHGSSSGSGSRPNAFDTVSTTKSVSPGTGSSACTNPLRYRG